MQISIYIISWVVCKQLCLLLQLTSGRLVLWHQIFLKVNEVGETRVRSLAETKMRSTGWAFHGFSLTFREEERWEMQFGHCISFSLDKSAAEQQLRRCDEIRPCSLLTVGCRELLYTPRGISLNCRREHFMMINFRTENTKKAAQVFAVSPYNER